MVVLTSLLMVYRPVRSCLRAQEMEYSGQSMAWQDTRNVLFQFPEEVTSQRQLTWA